MASSEDIIVVRDHYYILATSALADDRTLVLKHGDTFAVFDRYGDLQPIGQGQQGLFHGDTRFLSRLELRLDGYRPLLLSSTVTDDNLLLTVDVTNPDVVRPDLPLLPRDTVHVFRAAFLTDAGCYLQLRARNYGDAVVHLFVELRFDADFVDIFEVRGTRRAHRGTVLGPEIAGNVVRLGYHGLDRRTRTTSLSFEPAPAALSSTSATWIIDLAPGQEINLYTTVRCELDRQPAPAPPFEDAYRDYVAAVQRSRECWCQLYTSNEQFNDWVNRSCADLRMMVTQTPWGPYPYAGVPWFSTVFGRDGIITALETLWVEPDIAAGVLRFLAATQATDSVPERDAEPGKILHETRAGEMAALREVPFERYYGTIDATPLFVILAGAYHQRTGDDTLIASIWQAIERALAWCYRYGDRDHDGFVEYARRDERGLINQGWKDSGDSIFHADGSLAHGPVALCEVQAYVHGAYRAGATLAEALGRHAVAVDLEGRAEELRERFEQSFWSEELGTYVLALDGDKRPCRVRTSNAGQVLYTGIASPERARAVAHTLFADDSYSGWGIRTLSALERRYNPMSYHNGSVWPHDNALIAAGLARYGMKQDAGRILTGLLDASLFVDLHRLPELFCGFPRRAGEGPTLYPVACAPQSWSAGAVYMVMQACLGLSIDGRRRRVELLRPMLPASLRRVTVSNLRVGPGTLDLDLHRYGRGEVSVNVVRRDGDIEVTVVK